MAVNEEAARGLAKRLGYAAAIAMVILFIPPLWSVGVGAALCRSVFVPLAIGLTLLSSVEVASPLRSFLLWKPVQAIGVTSYGIYVWQQLFTAPRVFLSETGAVPNFSSAGEAITMCLPLLGLIIPVSYFLIEKPAIRLGRELSLRARQKQPVEVRNLTSLEMQVDED